MDDARATGVRSALDTVWALHGRDVPDPRRGLSVPRIVTAAIEIADREGLEALAMSRIAGSLGFTTMSLYKHVRNKEELLLLMHDTALGPPPDLDPVIERGGWRAGLEGWTWAVLGEFRRHPWLLRTIPMFGLPATPFQLAWLDRGLRCLAGTGLTEPEKLTVVMLLDAHIFGDLQFSSWSAGDEQGPQHDVLARLDPQEYPALVRAVEGKAFDDAGERTDEAFAFALARILDGIEAYIAQRG